MAPTHGPRPMADKPEIFEQYTSRRFDSKNKLNHAGKKKPAADFLARLESGDVEIEELDSLTLPVFVYQTQITIHGNFTALTNTRAGGYVSLTVNKNGSLGVKYSAIDAAKKTLIYDALREMKSAYFLYSDSSKCYISRSYDNKAEAVAEYHRLEIDGYLMKKQVYRSNYYGRISYSVYLDLFAIHAADVWPLLTHLDSAVTEEAVTTAREAREAKYAQERAKDNALAAERAAAAQQHFADVLAPFLAGLPAWDGTLPTEGIWLTRPQTGNTGLSVIHLKPKGKLWVARYSFRVSKPLTIPTAPPAAKATNIKPAELKIMAGYKVLQP